MNNYLTILIVTLCFVTASSAQHIHLGYRTEFFKTGENPDFNLGILNAVEAGIGISVDHKYYLNFNASYGFFNSSGTFDRDQSSFSNFNINSEKILKEIGDYSFQQSNFKLGLHHEFRLFKSKSLTWGVGTEYVFITKFDKTTNYESRYYYERVDKEIVIEDPIHMNFTEKDYIRKQKYFVPILLNLSAKLKDERLKLTIFIHTNSNVPERYDPKIANTYGMKILYRHKLERKSQIE